MTPTLIITRPDPQGRRFADQVIAQLGQDVPIVMSPAFEIVPIETSPPNAAHLILTSGHGAINARRLGLPAGMSAFCVGNRTAEVAIEQGYDAVSAGGDADALVALIKQTNPSGPLLHVAGRHTRGDVASRLGRLGFDCTYLAAYEQRPNPPSPTLQQAIGGNAPLVSPVFSPRSAAILAMPGRTAPLFGVAISPAVADVLTDLGADTIQIAERPDEASMVRATCHVLLRLIDRG